jgi:hypothetical protein
MSILHCSANNKKVQNKTKDNNHNSTQKNNKESLNIVAMLGVQCKPFFFVCPRLHSNPKNHQKRGKNITTLRNVIAQKEK